MSHAATPRWALRPASGARLETGNARPETIPVQPARIADLLAPFLQSPPGPSASLSEAHLGLGSASRCSASAAALRASFLPLGSVGRACRLRDPSHPRKLW